MRTSVRKQTIQSLNDNEYSRYRSFDIFDILETSDTICPSRGHIDKSGIARWVEADRPFSSRNLIFRSKILLIIMGWSWGRRTKSLRLREPLFMVS